MIEFILKRYSELERSGVIDQEHEALKHRAQSLVHSPAPVAGITKATKDRSWRYDPGYRLDRDLADQDGRVFYRAGTKVNPLEHVQLSKTLVFFDASDSQQLTWAFNLDTEKTKKYILVGGSPSEVMKAKKHPVFYDQRGFLTTRFGIQHSPATVQQDGLRLLIKEYAL